MIFTGLWIVAVLAYAATNQSAEADARAAVEKQSCDASKAVLSALQLVPYKLRVVDLVSVVPTLNALHNIRVEFFETDGRTTDKFTLIQRDKSLMVFEGETNWVGYRLTFLDPSDVNVKCLLPMNNFAFVPVTASGSTTAVETNAARRRLRMEKSYN